jgi:hypothetical protein
MLTHNLADEYEFERRYWGDCCNTFDEDQKHYIYASLMGLRLAHYSVILDNISVLDIGGGPSSMLLKCEGLTRGLVVDPIQYPEWTETRYNSMNIDVMVDIGENVNVSGFDEVWIYNCMQHTIDPEKIIHNAKRAAPVLRIFEWVDVPAHDGHPHELTEELLNKWTGGKGNTIQLAQQGCYGKAYFGVFE